MPISNMLQHYAHTHTLALTDFILQSGIPVHAMVF